MPPTNDAFRPNRRRLAFRLLATTLLAPAAAKANPLELIRTFGYAVDGKKGKFVDQAGKRPLDQSGGADLTASLGLDAINRGEYQESLLEMPETGQRVQALLAKVSAAWPHVKPAKVPVRMIGALEYGAEALADNSIKVYLGLINSAQTDEEIAFSLAHEYGHVVMGHLSRNGDLQKQRQLIGGVTRLYSQGMQLSESKVIKTGDKLLLQPGDRKKIEDAQARAAAASQRLRFLVDVFIEPAWSRHQEDEADALGLDLSIGIFAAKAGSLDTFQRLEGFRLKRKLLAEALQEQFAQSIAVASSEEGLDALSAGKSGLALDAIWKDFQRGMRQQAVKIINVLFKPPHRLPMDRHKCLTEYFEKAYRPPPRFNNTSKAWLEDVKSLGEFKEALAATAAVETSIDCRIAGDFLGAEKAILPVLNSKKQRFRNTPLVANEGARIFAALNKYDLSDKWFSAAHTFPNQSLTAYRDHVAMLLRAKRWERAKVIIQKGIAHVQGDRKPFLPALITIAFAQRQDAQGVTLLEECLKHEDPGLRQECATASIKPEDKERYEKLPAAVRDRIDQALLRAADTGQLTGSLESLNKTLQGFASIFERD